MSKVKHPDYDFPGCGGLITVLLALALLCAFGVAVAGSDTAQNLAHGNTVTVSAGK